MDPGRSAAVVFDSDPCPGLIRLHPAGDGDLARLRLPGGRLTPAQLSAVARACRRHGNGIVDITARANLQLRGVHDPAGMAAELARADLLPAPTHDRVRNILASPFGGRHPRSLFPTDAVVAALDRALCADPALAGLPSRFLFAVDDGSGTLDAGRADVVLQARPGGRFQVGARIVPAAEAVALALATHHAPGGPPAATREPRLGRLRQNDGRDAVTVLAPLGRLDPTLLDRLAATGCEVRLSTRRTITLLDVDGALSLNGFVTDEESGWWGLTACAGTACLRARADVRGLAADRARRRGPGDPTEHWSGCERACGRPADVDLEHVA